MNREILFRGKKCENQEWVEGDLIQYGEYESIRFLPQGKFVRPTEFMIITETVGQFTGLTDKNGKKIFEGDIFHKGDINIIYIVDWHDTRFMGKQNGNHSRVGLEYWMPDIEVIGNIHDNPELLK